MIRTCKVKLGRAPKQEAKILHVLDLCRYLYNAALEQRILAYKYNKVSLTLYDQQKELTQLRHEDEAYKSLPAELARLTSLDRLDKAFKSFFRRVRIGEKPGFPRFKGRDRFNTLVFGKKSWKIEGKKWIVRLGPETVVFTMRNQIHRGGEIKGVRLVRKAGRWWAHFQVEIGGCPSKRPITHPVGLDAGLKTFLALSDGETVDNPRFAQKSQGRLRAAHQTLSRKQKGSNNRRKAKAKLNGVYNKIENQRKNFVFQTVSSLAKTYDCFVIEDLNINKMLASEPKELNKKGSRGLHRNILDASWSMFFDQLENKAEEAGFRVIRVDPRGTSQVCSGCGCVVKKTLKDRIHECPECGLVLDRDLNAARNILKLGLNDLGCRSVCKSTEVSLSEASE